MNRYKNLDDLLANNDKNKKEIANIYHKFQKFMVITPDYLKDCKGSQTLNEYLLIEYTLKQFEDLLKDSGESKEGKEEEERKLKHRWLNFCCSFESEDVPEKKYLIDDRINKINDSLFLENQKVQQPKIISRFKQLNNNPLKIFKILENFKHTVINRNF